jgi:hypothetical protein
LDSDFIISATNIGFGETLPNLIKRKHPRKGQQKTNKGQGPKSGQANSPKGAGHKEREPLRTEPWTSPGPVA